MIPINKSGIYVNNKRKTSRGSYVGRPTPLGNPFTIEVHGREKAIELYKEWLDKKLEDPDSSQSKMLARLVDLYVLKNRKLTLLCFCAPKPCHAEYVRLKILERFEQMSKEDFTEKPK